MKSQQLQVLRDEQDRKFSALKILLMANAPIRSDKQLEGVILCHPEQVSIVQVGPAHPISCRHVVARQKVLNLPRSAVVEKDLQETAGALLSRARNFKTVEIWSRLTPSNWSKNSSTLRPRSRAESSDSTGTRVPRKTQAPANLPGRVSTAGQFDQSIIKLV